MDIYRKASVNPKKAQESLLKPAVPQVLYTFARRNNIGIRFSSYLVFFRRISFGHMLARAHT